jgi:hypothetical protein
MMTYLHFHNEQETTTACFYRWPLQELGPANVTAFSRRLRGLYWENIEAESIGMLIGLVFKDNQQPDICAQFKILTNNEKNHSGRYTFSVEFIKLARTPVSIKAKRGSELTNLPLLQAYVPHKLFCTKSGLFWIESDALGY